MQINKKLNLIAPIDSNIGTIHVHSTPISREVFEKYYRVLSKVFSRLFGEGHGFISGPRMAGLLLREAAQEMGIWDNPDLKGADVKSGLVAEILRLTNVLLPREGGGWQEIPYDSGRTMAVLDEDTRSEIENTLIFFTVVSSMFQRAEVPKAIQEAGELWNFRGTPWTFTEYRDSLQKSTQAEPTPTKEIPSSTPL